MKKIASQTKNVLLYAHCVPVRGKHQGAIYNFQIGTVTPVPNSMIDLIEFMKNHTINESKSIVDSEQYFWEYYDFLNGKDLVFLSDTPHLFPPIELKYFSPEHIKTAVIEYGINGYDLKAVFASLDALLCKHVELRLIGEDIKLRDLEQSLTYANHTTIRSIDIHFNFSSFVEEKELEPIALKFKKVNFINIYGADKEWHNSKANLHYSTADFNDISRRHFPRDIFAVNMPFFSEAQDWNVYYHKKVCIDRDGQIKNCLLHQTSYGSIEEHLNLLNIHKNKDFIWLWDKRPDIIEEVRDSEYRYCSLYTQNISLENGKFYLMNE